MAIRFITGPPGAGKSFYLVKLLRDSYYDRSPDGSYSIKAGITVISNIEGFKLEHLDLDHCIESAGGSKVFFSVPFFEKLIKKYPSPVVVIDEAQRFFDAYFKEPDALYLFQYHRHLGIDFYLSTQQITLLARGIRDLGEVEIRALRRSLSLFGEFKYKHQLGFEIFRYETCKRDKGVFSLYRSAVGEERAKIRKPMMLYGGIGLGVLVVGFILVFYVFGSWNRRIDEKKSRHGPGSLPGRESVRRGAVPSGVPGPVALAVDSSTYWVPTQFAAVGSDVFVVRYGEIVPLSTSKGRFRVYEKSGVVVDVREELSGEELKKREAPKQDEKVSLVGSDTLPKGKGVAPKTLMRAGGSDHGVSGGLLPGAGMNKGE